MVPKTPPRAVDVPKIAHRAVEVSEIGGRKVADCLQHHGV